MVSEEAVRHIALALPGTEDGGDRLAFTVDGKGFAWSWMERVEKKKPRIERRDVLAIWVADEGEKQALLAIDPAKFFTEDHYNGYPAVLVRLGAIEIEELEELLFDAWHCRAPRALVKAFEAERGSSLKG